MKSTKTAIILISTLVLAALAAGAAVAYPGALNLIPTCDLVGNGNLRLSYEADGHNQPYDDPYTEYFYTQLGIGDRFELGWDVYDTKNASTKYYNGKYLLLSETDATPAVAAGAMFIGKDSKTSYYGVACKTFGKSRLHFGAQTQDGETWMLAGADYAVTDRLCLLADYQSGMGRYHTLGLYWTATDTIGLTLYYVRNNTEELRDDNDYVGFNVGYTLPLEW